MSWSQVLQQFQGQGSIFWVAALSIAAGATLLVVSGLIAARKGLTGRMWAGPRLRRPASGYRRAVNPGASEQVEKTETGYRARGMAALGQTPVTATAGEAELAQLHQRLQEAARTLAGIQQAMRTQDQAFGFSGLKGGKPEVEYVFRAGIG